MSQGIIEDQEENVGPIKSSSKHYNDTEEAQKYTSFDDNKNVNTLSTTMNEGLWDNPKGWAAVFSAFLVNFCTFGTVFQWGNYQRLYLQIYGDQTDTFRISFVGTIGVTFLFCSGLFLVPVIQKLGYRGTMAIGTVLCPLGLIMASFATSIWQIYLSQGALFGIGAGLCYAPAIALPSQFFIKNRSFASGILFSGAGIGGLSISPMTDRLMECLGYRNALRIEGVVVFILLTLATVLAFSNSRPGGLRNGKGRSFVFVAKSILSRDLIALMVFCILVTFVYIAPFFLAPQYTAFLGHSPSDGAHLVSIISAMNCVSRVTMGFLGDRLGNLNTMLTCSLAAGIFNSILWQLSSDYNTYVVYCVLYGLTGGVYLSFLPVLIADIVGIENIQLGIGICFTATVVGILLGAPITGVLYQTFGWTCAIQFVGATTLAATLAIVYLRVRRSGGKLFVIV